MPYGIYTIWFIGTSLLSGAAVMALELGAGIELSSGSVAFVPVIAAAMLAGGGPRVYATDAASRGAWENSDKSRSTASSPYNPNAPRSCPCASTSPSSQTSAPACFTRS